MRLSSKSAQFRAARQRRRWYFQPRPPITLPSTASKQLTTATWPAPADARPPARPSQVFLCQDAALQGRGMVTFQCQKRTSDISCKTDCAHDSPVGRGWSPIHLQDVRQMKLYTLARALHELVLRTVIFILFLPFFCPFHHCNAAQRGTRLPWMPCHGQLRSLVHVPGRRQ